MESFIHGVVSATPTILSIGLLVLLGGVIITILTKKDSDMKTLGVILMDLGFGAVFFGFYTMFITDGFSSWLVKIQVIVTTVSFILLVIWELFCLLWLMVVVCHLCTRNETNK